jgi:hypothetical protein
LGYFLRFSSKIFYLNVLALLRGGAKVLLNFLSIQRMDTLTVRDPRALLRMRGDLLGRADGHRPMGLESRKQPWGWPVEFPIRAQFGQQAGGEESIAILAAFALLDAEQQALTFAIRELQPDDCTDAQTSGIRGHQEDAVPGMLRMREQALEFLDAQDLWELRPPRAWWEVEAEDIPAQGLCREELQPRSRLMAGTPCQAPLDEEVVQGGTHLLWTQAIRRTLVELGSAGDSGHRGLVGFRGQPLQLYIVDHLGT